MATEPRITQMSGRYASKPGTFLVRSVLAVREISLEELKKIPGFVRTTTEGVIFDTKTNAQNFLKSDLLKNVKAGAIKSRADASAIARQKKTANPKLFNKIIQLAEEGKTSVAKIGTNPEVLKLNKGIPITYTNIKNIITREKGKEFFNKVAETKQYYKSPDRTPLEKNLKNIMKDYYKGIGTVKLTRKYLPDSSAAKNNQSSTILEDVINKNIDPKKLANRPAAMGANQYGTRQEQIKVLKNFQNYLSKNTNKFTSQAAAEANLKNLFKGSDSGTIGNFVSRTNILRKAYNSKNLPEGFKVNQKVKDLIKYLPAQDFVESELRALGFSEKTIKSMNQVETAVQKMTTASTQLEHALPRSVIKGLNLPKKYYLMGERTTNFLNKFKMQFDGQMKNAAMTYAESNQTPADYKTYIKKRDLIRNKVRNLTGGYEIGYVDFDKAGNPIPKTNQMSFLKKGDAESVKAKGIENFKKNIQYHNTLKKNFNKNPNNPDFFTLREEIAESPRKFVRETPEFIKKINESPLKKIVEARVGCADGCLAAVAKNEPGKITRVLETLPAKARGFLSLLGRGGLKVAPYAAIAAIGAAAEPLVKQFRNDDPSTYMTDVDQQKGVLLSLVEQETPKVDEEILKWQYPGQIAGAAAAVPGSKAVYRARKLPFKERAAMGPVRAALGPVGKVLAGTFSPLAVAASLPIGIAAQRKGGTDWSDIATDPLNWVGPAFAGAGAEMATKGVRNPLLLKALRLGMSPGALRIGSRFLGLPGLALTAGLWGYDKWKNRDRDD
jgi:hypothetical protein